MAYLIKRNTNETSQKVGRHKNGRNRGNTAVGAQHQASKRRSRLTVLLALAFVLAGVALIAYPYVSDYLNKVEQAKVASTQQNVVLSTPKEDLSAYLAAAQDYNERLLEGRVRVTDPFDPNQRTTSDDEYMGLLNLAGDEVMGQIVIPKIGVDLPIYHGVTGDGMDHGVGHMPETSLPVGGASTHAVLAGHTGLPSARIFDDLDQLDVGDWFIIQVLGEDHAYRVTSIEIVLPEETQSLAIQDGQDLVTLVTCTPYGVNTHRLLVHAERCDVPQEWLDRDKTSLPAPVQVARDNPMLALTLIGVAVGLGVVVGLVLAGRHRRKRGGGGPGSGPSGKHARGAEHAAGVKSARGERASSGAKHARRDQTSAGARQGRGDQTSTGTKPAVDGQISTGAKPAVGEQISPRSKHIRGATPAVRETSGKKSAAVGSHHAEQSEKHAKLADDAPKAARHFSTPASHDEASRAAETPRTVAVDADATAVLSRTSPNGTDTTHVMSGDRAVSDAGANPAGDDASHGVPHSRAGLERLPSFDGDPHEQQPEQQPEQPPEQQPEQQSGQQPGQQPEQPPERQPRSLREHGEEGSARPGKHFRQ